MMEKHWVEELFPPHFTCNSLVQDTQIPAISCAEDNARDEPLLIQRLYDRVRVELNRRAKERQQKCIQVGEPLAEHLPQKSLLDESNIKGDSGQKTFSENIENEGIWSATELEILRQATQEAKEENTRLGAELRVACKQKRQHARKCKKQSADLASKESELVETQQEAERLRLQCEYLEVELGHARMMTRCLEEDVADLQQSKSKLRNRLKDSKQELNIEKASRKKLHRELEKLKKSNALESIVREDGIRLDYKRQIKRLYEELEEARNELEKEKKENVTVRKALDQLRIHFASLPANSAAFNGLSQLDQY